VRRQGAIPALRLALRVGLLAAPGEPSECCAFYTALLAALRRRPQVVEGCLEGVDVVFPPVDVGVVHYPSFLGELAATGEAKDAFFLRRLASAARVGEWLAETRLEPGQVALIVDVESSRRTAGNIRLFDCRREKSCLVIWPPLVAPTRVPRVRPEPPVPPSQLSATPAPPSQTSANGGRGGDQRVPGAWLGPRAAGGAARSPARAPVRAAPGAARAHAPVSRRRRRR